ncbi:MAG: hypothetical protein EBZ60_08390, partial [Betaproteobacteria bacterium]|nr:hypothetical protein [Betaproteobacteria bacterium]
MHAPAVTPRAPKDAPLRLQVYLDTMCSPEGVIDDAYAREHFKDAIVSALPVLRGAGGTLLEVTGSVPVEMSVTPTSQAVVLRLTVVRNLCVPFLLGFPGLQKLGATIDTVHGLCRFAGVRDAVRVTPNPQGAVQT